MLRRCFCFLIKSNLIKYSKIKALIALWKGSQLLAEVLEPKTILVGNSDFWFQFLGPPLEVEYQFCFWFRRFRSDFFWILLLKNWQIGIPIPKFGITKKIYVGTQYTSFCIRIMVAAIPTSTQNSKQLPPYLHLLKKVAVIPTSTQNGCRHTYIYSKRLPPYLHLFKTVATIPTSTQMVTAISTSTQNGCCLTYIYSKRLPSSLHLLKKVAAFSTSTQNE